MKTSLSLFESAISKLGLGNNDYMTICNLYRTCFESSHSFSDYPEDDISNPESDEYGTVLPTSDEQNELNLGDDIQKEPPVETHPNEHTAESSTSFGKDLIDSYIEYGKPISLAHYINKLIILLKSFSVNYNSNMSPSELSVESNKNKIKKILENIQEKTNDYTTKVTSPKSAKIIPAKDAIDSAFNNEFSSKSGYEDIKDRENAHELTMEELKKIAEEKGTGEAYETYRKSSPADPIGYNHDTLEDEFSPFEDKSQVESVMSDFFRVITRKLKSGTTAKPNMFASLSSKDYMNNIKKRSLDRIHAKKTVNDSKSSEDADLFSM